MGLYNRLKTTLYTSCSPDSSGFKTSNSTSSSRDSQKLIFWSKKRTLPQTWSSDWSLSWWSIAEPTKNQTILLIKSLKARLWIWNSTTIENLLWFQLNLAQVYQENPQTNCQVLLKYKTFTLNSGKLSTLKLSTISWSTQQMHTWSHMKVYNVWWCKVWDWWSVDKDCLAQEHVIRWMNLR